MFDSHGDLFLNELKASWWNYLLCVFLLEQSLYPGPPIMTLVKPTRRVSRLLSHTRCALVE